MRATRASATIEGVLNERSSTVASGDHPLVVAGFDGSEAAEHALRWAAEQARLRGARLRIVTAWDLPMYVYGAANVPAMVPSLQEDWERSARELVTKAAEDLGDAAPAPIETLVRRGQAAEVLLDASKDADHLVVGSRGRGGFASLLLGSVSEQCAQHASCPVTIVR
jgi:nucleotide-binding universal stress UspA family protein